MAEKPLTGPPAECKQREAFLRPDAEHGLRSSSPGTSELVGTGPTEAAVNPRGALPMKSAFPMLSTGAERTKATILVVDDSPEMLRYLRTILEVESFRVVTANNGVEALLRLQEGCAPAAVVLDLQMPVMDGLKTLQRLRKLRPNLKVIMCSGVEDPRKVRRAMSLGAEVFLHKPVQHLYLSAALQRCMNGTPSQAPVLGEHGVLVPMPLPKDRSIPTARLRASRIRVQASLSNKPN